MATAQSRPNGRVRVHIRCLQLVREKSLVPRPRLVAGTLHDISKGWKRDIREFESSRASQPVRSPGLKMWSPLETVRQTWITQKFTATLHSAHASSSLIFVRAART